MQRRGWPSIQARPLEPWLSGAPRPLAEFVSAPLNGEQDGAAEVTGAAPTEEDIEATVHSPLHRAWGGAPRDTRLVCRLDPNGREPEGLEPPDALACADTPVVQLPRSGVRVLTSDGVDEGIGVR